MTDIIIKNPLIDNTGEKLNLIKINFENAEGSTNTEIQEGTEKQWSNQNIGSIEEKLKLRDKNTVTNTHHLGKKRKKKMLKIEKLI